MSKLEAVSAGIDDFEKGDEIPGSLAATAHEVAYAFDTAHAAIRRAFKLKPENGGAGANERELTMELLGYMLDCKYVGDGIKNGVKTGALRSSRSAEHPQEPQS